MEKKKEASSIFSSKSALSDKSNDSGEDQLAAEGLYRPDGAVHRPSVFVLQTDQSLTAMAAAGCSPPTPAALPLTNHRRQRKVRPAEGAAAVGEGSSLTVLLFVVQPRSRQMRLLNPGSHQHPKQRNPISPSGTRTRTARTRSRRRVLKVRPQVAAFSSGGSQRLNHMSFIR